MQFYIIVTQTWSSLGLWRLENGPRPRGQAKSPMRGDARVYMIVIQHNFTNDDSCCDMMMQQWQWCDNDNQIWLDKCVVSYGHGIATILTQQI